MLIIYALWLERTIVLTYIEDHKVLDKTFLVLNMRKQSLTLYILWKGKKTYHDDEKLDTYCLEFHHVSKWIWKEQNDFQSNAKFSIVLLCLQKIFNFNPEISMREQIIVFRSYLHSLSIIIYKSLLIGMTMIRNRSESTYLFIYFLLISEQKVDYLRSRGNSHDDVGKSTFRFSKIVFLLSF